MDHIAYLTNHFLSINKCEQRYDHTRQYFNSVVVFFIFSYYYQMWKICIPTDRQQVIRICLKENLEYRVPKEFFTIKQIPKREKFKKKKKKLQRIFGWYVFPSLTSWLLDSAALSLFSFWRLSCWWIHFCLKIYIITCISLCMQEKILKLNSDIS